MLSHIIDQHDLSIDQFEDFYRGTHNPQLSGTSKAQVDRAAKIVADAATAGKAVYGVNTGFGKLAHTKIPPQDVAQLQRNLVLSHCCGVGEATPKPVVRLMMALKLRSLTQGASGVCWSLVELLCSMIEKDVYPIIPAQGSVGASGDLAPLAHMAAVMIGDGEAEYKGKRQSGSNALKAAGLRPITLGPKEGLALLNGTQFSCAYGLSGLFDGWRLIKSALVTGALSTDAAMGSTAPFRPEIHALRGHDGQIFAAHALRALMGGSPLRAAHRDDDERVQDPYCLRCQPQVMGAIIDTALHVGRVLKIEANAVTDNPLVLIETGDIISGGNFHAEPVGLAADHLAIALSEVGAISQRRIAMLVDPTLNFGLPAFLSPNPGVNSGFMIAEVTSAALMSENKHRANPCSTDSTPTSANQEDHVSMAAHGARRLRAMNENLAGILAIEWMSAAQGIELRAPLKTSAALLDSITALRTQVQSLGDDRYMADDITAATKMILDGALCAQIPSILSQEEIQNV